MRRRIAGLAEHAHHDAAIVARPDGAVGRQRIGAVALVAVDGRRRERGGGVGVGKQAGEKMQAGGGQPVACVAGERVAAAFALDQRLVQVPAAGKQIRQRRPAHEARQKAVAPRDLFGRGAEQDHGVGGVEAALRAEGEFALARPELDFQRAQRHAERGDAAADRLQRRVDLIEAALGEILIALVEQAHLGRLRRPGGVCGREPRVLQLEQMEFDFEAGEEIEARRLQPRQRVAKNLPRRERHRLAVWEIHIAQQPAGIRRPRQHLERRRVGHHDEIAAALHFRHVEAAAGA